MKSFISVIVLSIVLAACNNSSDESGTSSDNSAAKPATTSTECYLYIKNKDTIRLQMTINDKSVSGDLAYSFSEKDINQGVIQGELRGDTLLADYEFKSEGIVSVREVAFLKKGDSYAEGYGEAEEKEGKMMFKNVAGLTYSDTVVLRKINCK